MNIAWIFGNMPILHAANIVWVFFVNFRRKQNFKNFQKILKNFKKISKKISKFFKNFQNFSKCFKNFSKNFKNFSKIFQSFSKKILFLFFSFWTILRLFEKKIFLAVLVHRWATGGTPVVRRWSYRYSTGGSPVWVLADHRGPTGGMFKNSLKKI